MDKNFDEQLKRSREAHDKVPIEQVTFPCVWTDESTEWESWYSTACGEGFYFEDGGISENKFKFCPYCGFRIKEKK